ncbi:DNA gyrase subunit A [Litorilinea aerophila]|nr:DNA gyrase subunit A [Litorilinea aerophila]MCC9078261.1 DNA gyrase subunit A [Litorilinea aerophila]
MAEYLDSQNGDEASSNGAVNGEISSNGAGIGHVRHISIEEEMRASYLDYAMSVIVARALPDARDGLKPVHRRILYAMHDMGLQPNAAYKKSARIVGEVLGKYHPHGDGAVYDAMARMAQDFSLRYPLVDGQGNFGSVDGDSPAAMRYTEARLAPIAETMLRDIDLDTVDWMSNFDDSLQEPQVLPAMLPNLLVNGTSGIAVGMATNIPPHNLREIADAVAYLIDHWERRDEIGLDELMQFVKGPDFPTGGIILGTEGIKQAYGTGRGRILLRAKTQIEETSSGRFRIIVTEIPYQVNKSVLIERIAELVRNGVLDQISDLRDESDRTGMRIVIELKRGVAPKKVRNRLFKHTQLQTTFGVNNLALVRGEPVTLSLRKALLVYIEHRVDVLTRRTQYQLGKARERAHILEGLRIALQFLDEVIQTIRSSDSAEAARTALMERFGLTEVQAQAILDMQLRRLAALERQKIEEEYQEIMARIAYLEDLLANPPKIRALVRDDIMELREKFGDERRTLISATASGDFSDEDLITQDNVLISYSAGAYIKRMPANVFRAQGRGGRGVRGMATRQEDEVINLFFARTLDHILFFTDKGRVYSSRVYELPEGNRTSRGAHIANVLNLQPEERVTTMLVVPDFEQAEYVTLITRRGRIKRMDLNVFSNVRPSGLIAMSLEPGDSLDWARLTNGNEEFIVVTRRGKALRFHEESVRTMGRTAAGVMAIRLMDDDEVVSLDVARPGYELLVLHERGWGKRVPLSEYSVKGRYTQGYWTTDHRRLAETGPIVAARVVHEKDQITVITSQGIILRTAVAGISRMGRTARGVRVVNLQEEDTVAALAVLTYEDLNRNVADESPSDEDEEYLAEAEGAEAAHDGDLAAAPAATPAPPVEDA